MSRSRIRDIDTANLFEAVESGDLAKVKRFLKYPHIKAGAPRNTTAASFFSPNTRVNIVSLLLKHGADVDAPTARDRRTPLTLACCSSTNLGILNVLLAHGAAVNGPVGAYKTPLQEACYSGKADIVSFLLDHGADVDAFSAHYRNTPLTRACRWNTKLDIAQLLINAGAGVNGDVNDVAPLHQAAYAGKGEAIELLIKSGADVNILSNREYTDLPAGSTPLHFAVDKTELSSVDILLEAGADPNIVNARGRTPLHHAALWSCLDIVNALLDAGCDPLRRDNFAETPLQSHFYTHNEGFSLRISPKVITALVAAGDRSWECVPTPCLGLEAAMLSVWQNAPDEMPELVKRSENPPQNLIELFPRLNKEMKKVVREVLRVLHHHIAGYPHLKEHFMKSLFDFKFEEAVDFAAAAAVAAAAAAVAEEEEDDEDEEHEDYAYFTSDNEEDYEW